MIGAGQIYTDQTGNFPVISSKGNKCIMVLYEYDGNATLVELKKQNIYRITESLSSYREKTNNKRIAKQTHEAGQ
jgi:hypothetical protein